MHDCLQRSSINLPTSRHQLYTGYYLRYLNYYFPYLTEPTVNYKIYGKVSKNKTPSTCCSCYKHLKCTMSIMSILPCLCVCYPPSIPISFFLGRHPAQVKALILIWNFLFATELIWGEWKPIRWTCIKFRGGSYVPFMSKDLNCWCYQDMTCSYKAFQNLGNWRIQNIKH